MSVATALEFLDLLSRSNLLPRQQVTQLRISTAADGDPLPLAQSLIKARKLTRWQAQQLLDGRTAFYLGKYKLLEQIGQGGMGAVFKAEQSSLHRTVAIKLMAKEVLQNPAAVERFLREIRSAAALDHTNIVRAYDADCVGEHYFLVLEYVSGRDLKAWHDQYGANLPIRWACECARQVALGLQHAFEQGMVHRDIKPSNLLVVQQSSTAVPVVKILDMGLARFLSESQADGEITRSGQILGTPDYISPEQARNTRQATIRSDIYSLGCTLFQLLTGRVAFPGENVMEKLAARLTDSIPRARDLRPEIPQTLDAVLAKMLARDPEHRYAQPIEVARALTPFALGEDNEVSDSSLVMPLVDDSERTPQPAEQPSLNDFLNQLAESIPDGGLIHRSRTAEARQFWLGGVTAAMILLVLFGMFQALQRYVSWQKERQTAPNANKESRASIPVVDF